MDITIKTQNSLGKSMKKKKKKKTQQISQTLICGPPQQNTDTKSMWGIKISPGGEGVAVEDN